MSDSGMGSFGSFMLGRMSVQHDQNMARMIAKLRGRARNTHEDDVYEQQNREIAEMSVLLEKADAALTHGLKYADKLEGQIARLQAQLAEAEHNVALYQTGLQAGHLRITELERQLEASRDMTRLVANQRRAYVNRYGVMSEEEIAQNTWWSQD